MTQSQPLHHTTPPLVNRPCSAAAICAPVTTPGIMYTTKLQGIAAQEGRRDRKEGQEKGQEEGKGRRKENERNRDRNEGNGGGEESSGQKDSDEKRSQ
jgi:hypothetical protein